MVEFKLPDVGEGMHEGEIISWLVKEGDSVTQDQPVVEVQTDKVNAELSSPITGKIEKILVEEGEVAEVGTTLFTIVPEGTVVEEKNEQMNNENSVEQMKQEKRATPTEINRGRALATPYVRQLAREWKVDLEQVKGTGPAGRITEDDLQRFVNDAKAEVLVQKELVSQEKQKEAPQEKTVTKDLNKPEKRIPMKGIRKKIAEHMVKSVSTIPHVTHVDEMEMGPLKEIREQLKPYAEEKSIKLTFLPFFIKAIVTALKEFETLNASIDDETNEIIVKQYYHIGIATDTKDGLVVPVIKDADRKSIFELAAEISQLATQAREGTLALHQITGSTFTISNVGPIGGMQATPIINHPEVAILALHKMEPRMVVRDWEGVIRLMMNMSLSFDHRIIDGVTAVKFTNRLKELLEKPNLLFMEMS
ncbi:dihydrolipoamide acetyltransferase family protein [Alkalihalobacillus sp. LMS39]|uniref:dihydrolipoamide acetyltransferase family protein n=1 Tax=Alkalihalobacillus sp. LMS39 TaxID=2924032 RepID=UPI001FB38D50|nr:dihydrolipoamide acetyltransferase family protein [Alkalihalobacillus sp. LMS39]UOE94902.1 2-oxo acid dehydrogenase subunit E2 [Alkalihalobacillus sp. LMS39]